ncbi:MAG: hypothetical protein IJ278_03115 [Clostridia bacterium]|nr:hypothetical protein [Clostridia bacterium]
MADYKRLYFHLFAKVADVIEEYNNMPKYEKIVKKLIKAELETEDMYMRMPDDPEDLEKERESDDWEE